MSHRVPEQLLRHAPDSNIAFFFCDNDTCTESYQKCTTCVINGDDYDWAVRLQCTVCSDVWWICNECSLRKKIHEHHVLCRHQYTNHGNKSRNKKRKAVRKKKREDEKIEENKVEDIVVDEPEVIVEDVEEPEVVVDDVVVEDVVEDEVETDFNLDSPLVDFTGEDNDSHDTVTQEDIVANQYNEDLIEPRHPVTLTNDAVNIVHSNYIRDSRINIPYSQEKFTESKLYLSLVRSDLIDELTKTSSIHPPSNSNVSEFYSFDLLSSGRKFLIAKMCSGEHGTVTDILRSISGEEVDCQLLISDFVSTLTRDQQRQFGKVIDNISKVYFQSERAIYDLPRTIADVRRMYIDGSQSVLKNLPIPNVTRLKNHSYVSLMDCVSDFLLRQKQKINNLEDYHNMKFNKNNLSLFNSERTMEIIQEAIDRDEDNEEVQGALDVVVLFLKIWSDDFDPNSSIKSNRQSVWVKTVTIFAMAEDGTKVSATYPVATAPKGVDHAEVEHRFGKELTTLSIGQMMPFFCRNNNEPVFIHANIFCVLADQPERRTNLKLSAGNSSHHKRFGFLTDYHQCIDVIRSCKECSVMIEQETLDQFEHKKIDTSQSKWREGNCLSCSCWMYPTYDALLSYIPEKAYPTSKIGKDGMVRMKTIRRTDLMSCLDDVNLAIERNIWTTTTCKAYLKASGFHTKAIEEIIEGATNYAAYCEARDMKNVEPHQWMVMKTDRDKNPRKYQQWEIPLSWYDMETTDLFVDVPMHLLLLGVSKSVYIKVSKWLKMRHQGADFKEASKGILDQLKLYSLDWCKMLLYPHSNTDKFGGWVAENFLGFIRISNWFYSLLYIIRKPARVDPTLETPRCSWKGKENKFWLEIRGLETDGNVKVLKERVDYYYNMIPQPPVLETNVIGIDDIMKMINSLNVMISLVMSPRTRLHHIPYLESAIRHFLICYDKVDQAMTSKNEKPSWMTQYNFLCLLNLPAIMSRFGCLRNIWEGGVEGEGFLRKYKKELKHGLRPQWQIYAIVNLLRRGVYDNEIFPNGTKWKVELAKECRIYNTYKIMMMVVMSGEPISAIYIPNKGDEKIFMVYRTNKRKIKIWHLKIDMDKYEDYCHMKYYSISLSSDTIDITEDIARASTGCLLLPKITETSGFERKTETSKYCIIYSDWRF